MTSQNRLNGLVGKWIIRSQNTEKGSNLFKNEPVFLMNLTDKNLIIIDPLNNYKLDIFEILSHPEIDEEIRKSIITQELNTDFYDEYWISVESLYVEHQEVKEKMAVELNKKVGTFFLLPLNLSLDIGTTHFYVYNVTDTHALVYNPNSIYAKSEIKFKNLTINVENPHEIHEAIKLRKLDAHMYSLDDLKKHNIRF